MWRLFFKRYFGYMTFCEELKDYLKYADKFSDIRCLQLRRCYKVSFFTLIINGYLNSHLFALRSLFDDLNPLLFIERRQSDGK